MSSIFTYFTSGFGALALSIIFLELVTGERIQVGPFGILILLALSVLYALIRKLLPSQVTIRPSVREQELNEIYMHPSYPQFIDEDPERNYIYKEDIPSIFNDWLDSRSDVIQNS